MVKFYFKKMKMIERQLEMARIGYKEKVIQLTKENGQDMMQEITNYALAIVEMEKELEHVKNAFMKASEEEREKNEDNK